MSKKKRFDIKRPWDANHDQAGASEDDMDTDVVADAEDDVALLMDVLALLVFGIILRV